MIAGRIDYADSLGMRKSRATWFAKQRSKSKHSTTRRLLSHCTQYTGGSGLLSIGVCVCFCVLADNSDGWCVFARNVTSRPRAISPQARTHKRKKKTTTHRFHQQPKSYDVIVLFNEKSVLKYEIRSEKNKQNYETVCARAPGNRHPIGARNDYFPQ